MVTSRAYHEKRMQLGLSSAKAAAGTYTLR